jgi:photosystem II stability/assembly factor-like uncharacterized protein
MDATLLVGTTKGLFVLRAGGARDRWTLHDPAFRGRSVYALAVDTRGGRRRLWAASASAHWGAVLHASDDGGETWSEPESASIKFPEDTGLALEQIWQICPGRDDEPERLFVGVSPAALFESNDAGATFSIVRSLFDHPHRPKWQAGAGGLCLHTILPHPTDKLRMLVAISSAGVYRTDDGGATWRTAHRGVRAQFLPDPHPEFGQCVHKIAFHPSAPERLFLQNHWGLYRSDDGGDSWQDIARGVPSDFGFPMVVHPRQPSTAFIVPLDSDEFRATCDGKLRVYRTRDGGGSWQPLAGGLPQEHAYETVLRDGMCADSQDPTGIYFGTRSGRVYGSRDDGDSWRQLIDGLPPVTCVRAT